MPLSHVSAPISPANVTNNGSQQSSHGSPLDDGLDDGLLDGDDDGLLDGELLEGLLEGLEDGLEGLDELGLLDDEGVELLGLEGLLDDGDELLLGDELGLDGGLELGLELLALGELLGELDEELGVSSQQHLSSSVIKGTPVPPHADANGCPSLLGQYLRDVAIKHTQGQQVPHRALHIRLTEDSLCIA